MKKEKRRIQQYYQIRTEVIGVFVVLLMAAVLENVVWLCSRQESCGQIVQEEQENAERISSERKSIESVESKLENTEECYLCGYNSRSLMGMYRDYDDLGIICVNHWHVETLRIRNRDDAGNLTGQTGSMNVTYTGTGEGGDLFRCSPNSDRGISETSVIYGKDSILDIGVAEKIFCQGCLDKLAEVTETYGPEGEPAAPKDLLLVDFQTLELYSLQEYHTMYYIRDYYVRIEYQKDGLEVLAVYAPVLQNGEKE